MTNSPEQLKPGSHEQAGSPDKKTIFESIVNAVDKCVGLIKEIPTDKLSNKEKWIINTLSAAKEKTIDRGKSSFTIDIKDEQDEVLFPEEEGIPVDDAIEFLKQQRQKAEEELKNLMGDYDEHKEFLLVRKGINDDEESQEIMEKINNRNKELDELCMSISTLEKNSETYEEMHPNIHEGTTRWEQRVRHEAKLIHEDPLRRTGSAEGDWYEAESSMRKRRVVRPENPSAIAPETPADNSAEGGPSPKPAEETGNADRPTALQIEYQNFETQGYTNADGSPNKARNRTPKPFPNTPPVIHANDERWREGGSIRYRTNFAKIKERNNDDRLSDKEIHDFIRFADMDTARLELAQEVEALIDALAKNNPDESALENALRAIAAKTGIPIDDYTVARLAHDGTEVNYTLSHGEYSHGLLRTVVENQRENIQRQAEENLRASTRRFRRFAAAFGKVLGYGAAGAAVGFATGGVGLLAGLGAGSIAATRILDTMRSGRLNRDRLNQEIGRVRTNLANLADDNAIRARFRDNILAEIAALKQAQIDSHDARNHEFDQELETAEQQYLDTNDARHLAERDTVLRDKEALGIEVLRDYFNNLGLDEQEQDIRIRQAMALYRIDDNNGFLERQETRRDQGFFQRLVNGVDRAFGNRLLRGGRTIREKLGTSAVFTVAGIAAREVPGIRRVLMGFAGAKAAEAAANFATSDNRGRYRILRQVRDNEINAEAEPETIQAARALLLNVNFRRSNPTEYARLRSEIDGYEQTVLARATNDLDETVDNRNIALADTLVRRRRRDNERKIIRTLAQILGATAGAMFGPDLVRQAATYIRGDGQPTPGSGGSETAEADAIRPDEAGPGSPLEQQPASPDSSDYAVPSEQSGAVPNAGGADHVVSSGESSGTPEQIAPAYQHIKAHRGDSVWTIGERHLTERFEKVYKPQPGVDAKTLEALRTFNTDHLKDVIAANPQTYGLPVNVNIDRLTVAQLDKLDFNKAMTDAFPENRPFTILSTNQVESIVRQNKILRDYVRAHPGEPFTTQKVEEILRNARNGVKPSTGTTGLSQATSGGGSTPEFDPAAKPASGGAEFDPIKNTGAKTPEFDPMGKAGTNN